MKTQNQEKSWKTRARNWVAGGLVGLTALVSGCGSNNQLIDKNTVIHPYVETAFVSDYVQKHGAVMNGQGRQDLVNFDLNDRLSAFVWQNYSHEEKAVNERDFGFCYKLPLTDKLSARVGYQYWDYPSGTFGEHDEALKAGAHYKSLVNLDFDLTQLIPNDQGNFKTESGTRYYLKASKDFPVGKIFGCDVTLTPSISTSYIDNYYGNSGLSQVTPGINLGISKGNFNANFFINKQDGKVGYNNFNWSGVSVGYKF